MCVHFIAKVKNGFLYFQPKALLRYIKYFISYFMTDSCRVYIGGIEGEEKKFRRIATARSIFPVLRTLGMFLYRIGHIFTLCCPLFHVLKIGRARSCSHHILLFRYSHSTHRCYGAHHSTSRGVILFNIMASLTILVYYECDKVSNVYSVRSVPWVSLLF